MTSSICHSHIYYQVYCLSRIAKYKHLQVSTIIVDYPYWIFFRCCIELNLKQRSKLTGNLEFTVGYQHYFILNELQTRGRRS